MAKPEKLDFDFLKDGMRTFLSLDEVEREMNEEAVAAINRILFSESGAGGEEDSRRLLGYIGCQKEKLRALLTLSGGTIESFKRIHELVFPGSGSGFRGDKISPRSGALMVKLLLAPEDVDGIPPFIREKLRLPKNWKELLSDREYLRPFAFRLLQSKYSVRVGKGLENEIRLMVRKVGMDCEKGKVRLANNKEVDVAVPSCENPRILIMSSYSLTTSSSQTSRANEQAAIYKSLRDYRLGRGRGQKDEVIFVNVVDGGG